MASLGFKDKTLASRAGAKSKPGKHKKTLEWEALGQHIVTTHAERFNEVLKDSDNDEFAKLFLQVLNYFKPKINYNINDNTEPTVINSITFDKE